VNLSTRARVTIVLLGVILASTYLVIVDLGLSAGRIHRGVDVKGVDVGGLTPTEAYEKLLPIGKDLAENPIVFLSDVAGFDCRFEQSELGWSPRPFNTARKALGVGREGGPFTGLVDRARAWIFGITIGWDDEPDRVLVNAFVRECAEDAVAAGVQIDTVALKEEIVELVGRWPYEQLHPLPVQRS
jgi:hypothetical protein